MKNYPYIFYYGHENYLADMKRINNYKQDIKNLIDKIKLPILKKRKVKRLVEELCSLKFLLSETEQQELMINKEIWKSDCLEYNVDDIYNYILENSITQQKIYIQDIYELCKVENSIDIKYIQMNECLRRSKEINPIIILCNDMFITPFVINGNHRIINLKTIGNEFVEVYVINADDVMNCLISEDYKKAYRIYQRFYKLTGVKLNC